MEIIKLLLGTIFFLAFTYFNASYDADRIKDNKGINHYDESSVRLIIMCLLSLAIVYTFKVKHVEAILFIYFVFILYFAALFWLIFDYLLNNLRGLPWDYESPDISNKSSYIDRLFKSYFHPNDVAHVILTCKIIFFVLVLILIVYIIPHKL